MPVPNRPGTPCSIDDLIEQQGGISSAIGFRSSRVQQSKKDDCRDRELYFKGRKNWKKGSWTEESLRADNAYFRVRLLSVVRELTYLRAENAYLLGLRKASMSLYSRNIDSVISQDACLDALGDALRSIFDTSGPGTSERARQDIDQMADQFRKALIDCRAFSAAIRESSVEFASQTRLLEEDWVKCVENKI
ncbi:uncharacterized protein GIQ15_01635 [Arthroderma uncinatum]|uniref:uncharacterized protein n=1 Tax=Arthroderma uncinatum TaxID=74035 RepID=UPI00144A9D55|nr:uncharacterized protein GIQ15_01635 [Arthroderma uncinatum]KAF3492118.1 hypothetical protein GIQ15_01635 [Arthroderma uncinatum]